VGQGFDTVFARGLTTRQLAEALGITSVSKQGSQYVWKEFRSVVKKWMDKGFDYAEAQRRAEKEVLAKVEENEKKKKKKGFNQK